MLLIKAIIRSCRAVFLTRLDSVLNASINWVSYLRRFSGRGSVKSNFNGSRLITLAAFFWIRENNIMVKILSAGRSSRTAASMAVNPRLMPWPSMRIFGGRYFNFLFRLLEIETPIIKTINSRNPPTHRVPVTASGDMPNCCQRLGLVTADAGT